MGKTMGKFTPKDKTLEYYNKNAAEYAESTLNVDMSNVLDEFVKGLPPGARILDLGYGSGRDSKKFVEMGFHVTAIDGSAELCEIASKTTGLGVRCLLFQDLDYEEIFDGIWACSSLHHLTREDLQATLLKVMKALVPGGLLFTCFKYGNADFDDERGRHFTCATEDTVPALLDYVKAAIEPSSTRVWITGDNLDGRELRWVNVIVQRIN
ncbi:MAG: class I SAM-dependent methyltransferase [Clostridia bacterium]|nr:class I SAM-dependent methyltransferase [Clostridia bacterium]MDO5302837.1 class I SAM-dependent methyltransferase [Clostridia bacterium]